MSIGIYLNFDGNANEAIDFYSKVFDVEKNDIMTYGDMPSDPTMEIPENEKKLIMNTELNIKGTTIMFSDRSPSMTGIPFVKGTNISMVVNDKNKELITTLFENLKDGGKVEMELAPTFWSDLFGSVQDRFGITWELNYDSEPN